MQTLTILGETESTDIPVFRNKHNRKWYALIFELNNKTYVNLKCSPEDS